MNVEHPQAEQNLIAGDKSSHDVSPDPDLVRALLDFGPLLGVPTGMHQLASGLVTALKDRPDVSVSGYVLSTRASSREVIAMASRLGVPVRRSRLPARLCHLGWAFSKRPALARLTQDSDLVHGTNYSAMPAQRRLITAPDMSPLTHPQWCSPAVRGVGRALRRAVQQGAHLHVCTQSTAVQAAEVLGVPQDRVHVVAIGVEAAASGDAAAACRLVGSERFVLALGATEPRKALTCLPPAMAALPADVKLVVAGPCGRDEPALQAAVKDSGISDRFMRLTEVDETRKADLLAGATVLAYPSVLEGFGLPPLEAAAAGTPVVATAVGVLAEIFEPEVRLVPAGDATAFSERLAETLAAPQSVTTPVRDRIAALTWDHAAEQLARVYRIVASS